MWTLRARERLNLGRNRERIYMGPVDLERCCAATAVAKSHEMHLGALAFTQLADEADAAHRLDRHPTTVTETHTRAAGSSDNRGLIAANHTNGEQSGRRLDS